MTGKCIWAVQYCRFPVVAWESFESLRITRMKPESGCSNSCGCNSASSFTEKSSHNGVTYDTLQTAETGSEYSYSGTTWLMQCKDKATRPISRLHLICSWWNIMTIVFFLFWAASHRNRIDGSLVQCYLQYLCTVEVTAGDASVVVPLIPVVTSAPAVPLSASWRTLDVVCETTCDVLTVATKTWVCKPGVPARGE